MGFLRRKKRNEPEIKLPAYLLDEIGRTYVFERRTDTRNGEESVGRDLVSWGTRIFVLKSIDQLEKILAKNFPELSEGQVETAARRWARHLENSMEFSSNPSEQFEQFKNRPGYRMGR